MNIGIDIDGTIVNFSNKFTQHMARDKGIFILNNETMNWHIQYEEYEAEKTDECFELKFYPDAELNILKLSLNNRIHFITKRGTYSRDTVKQKIKDMTKIWQEKYFPYVKSLNFADKKEKFAIDKTIDIMIEDDAMNANAMAPYCHVLLLSRSWNREFKLEPNITVVEDWDEVNFVIEHREKFNV